MKDSYVITNEAYNKVLKEHIIKEFNEMIVCLAVIEFKLEEKDPLDITMWEPERRLKNIQQLIEKNPSNGVWFENYRMEGIKNELNIHFFSLKKEILSRLNSKILLQLAEEKINEEFFIKISQNALNYIYIPKEEDYAFESNF